MDSVFESIYKPDVLSCLADLSNDEVFTPPEVANDMLDLLPQELFSDPNTKFLDPACKSGVFLREIAKRLIVGLETIYPDLQERLEHIFHEQLYGVAITELTSLLSRRSLYCAKYPNSPYSVSQFDNVEGNIRYRQMRHSWKDGKCIYCGASMTGDVGEAGREGLETHAYEWIHVRDPKEIMNMKFDVIISNPPYQLNDGGGEGSSATPLYHKFVEQAKKLNPRYLSMIIPARWYSGGKGLDSFRTSMMTDRRMAVLHDFPETADCFPGVNIRGGVCYFLWDRDYAGDCRVVNHKGDDIVELMRPLCTEGSDVLIRYNKAIPIIKKVKAKGELTMDERVSSRLPFGIPSNFSNYSDRKNDKYSVLMYRSDRSKTTPKEVFIQESSISKNQEWKDRKKVLVSKASPGGDEYPHQIIGQPILALENSVCTETYLIVDFVNNAKEGDNLIGYMRTRFFRFLMAMIKNTQNISKGVFGFVPVQDWTHVWTDEKLYSKYGINSEEIAFIESMVREMN